MTIHHLNCGVLHVPPGPRAACHCLLIEQEGQLALIDSGIGLQDIAAPLERVGADAIAAAGFQFHESLTAARQIEALGFARDDVVDVVLTHADPDHAGGLADFPMARVHLAAEELEAVNAGSPRYSPAQFAHSPRWRTYAVDDAAWFGLPARRLELSFDVDALLIPLLGHTRGHCGVAVREGDGWLLHVGDAYYLRLELNEANHPVSALATLRAEDDAARCSSLTKLVRLQADHSHAVAMFGYHDFSELPRQYPECAAG